MTTALSSKSVGVASWGVGVGCKVDMRAFLSISVLVASTCLCSVSCHTSMDSSTRSIPILDVRVGRVFLPSTSITIRSLSLFRSTAWTFVVVMVIIIDLFWLSSVVLAIKSASPDRTDPVTRATSGGL
jgi:hypothetical protein